MSPLQESTEEAWERRVPLAPAAVCSSEEREGMVLQVRGGATSQPAGRILLMTSVIAAHTANEIPGGSTSRTTNHARPMAGERLTSLSNSTSQPRPRTDGHGVDC